MKTVWVLAAICAAALLAAAATTLVYGTQRRMEACERREAIVEAFAAYTDALIAAGEDTERTPAEQDRRDRTIAEFRADLDERLAPLEPTDC